MDEEKEYSLEERLNHVSVWRNSGLLLANYSKQTGIGLKTLRYNLTHHLLTPTYRTDTHVQEKRLRLKVLKKFTSRGQKIVMVFQLLIFIY